MPPSSLSLPPPRALVIRFFEGLGIAPVGVAGARCAASLGSTLQELVAKSLSLHCPWEARSWPWTASAFVPGLEKLLSLSPELLEEPREGTRLFLRK